MRGVRLGGRLSDVIAAIGTDLTGVARLGARLESCPALAGRLFTAREREACRDRPASLAGRFAAKEAALKAFGSALDRAGLPVPDGWCYTDVEVVSGPGTPPCLVLHGVARATAERLGIVRWHLSTSHEGDLAQAVVVAEGLRADAPL